MSELMAMPAGKLSVMEAAFKQMRDQRMFITISPLLKQKVSYFEDPAAVARIVAYRASDPSAEPNAEEFIARLPYGSVTPTLARELFEPGHTMYSRYRIMWMMVLRCQSGVQMAKSERELQCDAAIKVIKGDVPEIRRFAVNVMVNNGAIAIERLRKHEVNAEVMLPYGIAVLELLPCEAARQTLRRLAASGDPEVRHRATQALNKIGWKTPRK